MRWYKRMSAAGIVALVAVLLAAPAQATIQVSISPPNQVLPLAAGSTTFDIVAVIPESDAIVSWGLDVLLSGLSASISGASVNQPTWTAAIGADGDPYAGLAPTPPGAAIWSDPAPIVLATVTLSLDAIGLTTIDLADDNPADLTEGFALNPPPVGAFADVVYTGGSVLVIPEPATLALVALGALGTLRRRGRAS